jgi:Mesyanzhinovviridae DNA primase
MSNNNPEDRSWEDEYAGRGTFVNDDAKLRPNKKAKVDHEPEEEQPPRRERRSGTNSSPRAPPNADEALAFLKALRREGPWVLTAIIPDGATTTRTFEAADETGVREFIETNNATKNIYFTGNPCGHVSKKPTKADMTGAIFLHTDDDPREGETPEIAKAPILAGYDAHDPQPSIVIDSGNGLQGIWLLDAEYQFPEKGKVEEIELRNKALAASLGTTPGTHNVDRLLRLPGTVNIPNEAKRKRAASIAWRGSCGSPMRATL